MCAYNRKDFFYSQAKEHGYRSRASYKLLEINDKYKVLRPKMRVVEFGCFPGGWLQVALEKVGAFGQVVGVDLKAVEQVTVRLKDGAVLTAKTIIGDVLEEATIEQVFEAVGGRVQLLLSDMSPQLSGIRFRDVAFSAELVEQTFRVAPRLLAPGGNVIAKVFPGKEADELFQTVRGSFESLNRLRLKATRDTSTEQYWFGKNYRGALTGKDEL